MTQPHLTEPYDPAAAEDYRQQARDFLGKSREYLSAGDLHQASEKGWGAAAWMAKAVAVTQGWPYERHDEFNVVLNDARVLTGNLRLLELRGIANDLHRNYYTRKRFLNAEEIGLSLDNMAELLDILEPLTGAGGPAPA
jgi:RecB family exonuclease